MNNWNDRMNLAQFMGWCGVLIASVMYLNCLPGWLLWLALFVQLLNIYDLFQILRSGGGRPVLPWILQNVARVVFIGLLLAASHWQVSWKLPLNIDPASALLLVWSISEFSRFSFYVWPLPVFKMLRYNAFLVCYPLGVLLEVIWMYHLYQHLPFIFGKILIGAMGAAYLFGFPYLFLHRFRSRQQKFKP